MRFAHTVPTAYLEDFDEYNDMYLILIHEAQNNKAYREFMKKSTKYKILDNGAYEKGYPAPIRELIKMAEELNVDEIVLPDTYREAKYTKVHVITALDYLKANNLMGKWKLMAVPQGKTHVDYIDCLHNFIFKKEIDTIGLSFIIIKDCFKDLTGIDAVMPNRCMLTAYIHNMVGTHGKEFHLLGMENCKELTAQKHYTWLAGADSSTAFVHGMNGITFNEKEGLPVERIKTKLDFNIKGLTKDKIIIIKYNMGLMNVFHKIY